MSHLLDISLVVLAVSFAVVYLVRKKISSAKKISRDWASGHAESCSSCPVIDIRRRQIEKITLTP